MRTVQVLLKGKISEANDHFERKLERKLSMREVCSGMKTITAFTNSRGVGGRPNELNVFFNRSNTAGNTHPPINLPVVSLRSTATPLPPVKVLTPLPHLSLSLTARFKDK